MSESKQEANRWRDRMEPRYDGISYPGVADRCRNCRKTYAAHIRIGTKANAECFKKHLYDFRQGSR